MTQMNDPTHASGPPTRVVPSHEIPRRPRFAFLRWVFSGFGLLDIFGKKGPQDRVEEVVVYSVHRSFFLWLLILVGFVGGALVKHYPAGRVPHVMGWLYIWVLLYTFVVAMFDVGTVRFLLWGLVFAFIWVASKYIEAVRSIHLLSGVFNYLRNLRPELNHGFATVVSWLLLGPWIGSLFRTFSRGRKSFSPNGIEEWFLGDGREVTDRSGLHFVSRYTDLFKMLLGFGSGDLEAIDNTGKITKRWPNILFLFFVWKKLDQILHERAAVVNNTRQEPVEVEDVGPGATK